MLTVRRAQRLGLCIRPKSDTKYEQSANDGGEMLTLTPRTGHRSQAAGVYKGWIYVDVNKGANRIGFQYFLDCHSISLKVSSYERVAISSKGASATGVLRSYLRHVLNISTGLTGYKDFA